jgi:hypothetical protein
MKAFPALFFLYILTTGASYAQKTVDREKFFEDTSIVNATLTFNMGKLLSKKEKIGMIFPATFSCKSGDTIDVNDQILLEVRGHYRREHCDMPPLKVIFKKNPSAAFYELKQLKLVNACQPNTNYDQYLLKEYLCYKMYNLISPMSLRARLLDLNYRDSSGKKKMITKHAFLLEDPYRMAKRNKCIEFLGHRVATERTDRSQMTLLALFEYLIGNTDWSVPNYHNIILLQSKKDSTAQPLPVGYDFDYSGMVNTDYAIPDESLGTTSVRERVYRGFPRTMEELNTAFEAFRAQKDNIYAVVENFNLLTKDSKDEMTQYLDDFYKTINNEGEAKSVFITKARRR